MSEGEPGTSFGLRISLMTSANGRARILPAHGCRRQRGKAAVLAHRITSSGELTTHQSYRVPASVAKHSLAKPTTNKRCPTTHYG